MVSFDVLIAEKGQTREHLWAKHETNVFNTVEAFSA